MGFVNLELDLLRTFVVAVDAGSFARAADLVGRTASAVSLQIDRLENLCGQQLFRREGRQFPLTAAGEKLLVYARRLLALNDEALGALDFAEHSEIVRLGIPEDIASGCLPHALQRFAAESPKTHVSVRIARSVELRSAVERGELDLAVVYGRHERGGGEHVADLPVSWIGNSLQQHWDFGDTLRLVLFEPPCIFRSTALEALERSELKWDVVFQSPNLVGQWAAVKAGLGVSVRLLSSIPPDLVALSQENGLPAISTVPISLQTSHQLTASIRDFRDLLLQVLPGMAEPQGAAVIA